MTTDPLRLTPPSRHPELDPASYGFAAGDMDRPIFIDNVLGLETASLREILEEFARRADRLAGDPKGAAEEGLDAKDRAFDELCR